MNFLADPYVWLLVAVGVIFFLLLRWARKPSPREAFAHRPGVVPMTSRGAPSSASRPSSASTGGDGFSVLSMAGAGGCTSTDSGGCSTSSDGGSDSGGDGGGGGD